MTGHRRLKMAGISLVMTLIAATAFACGGVGELFAGIYTAAVIALHGIVRLYGR